MKLQHIHVHDDDIHAYFSHTYSLLLYLLVNQDLDLLIIVVSIVKLFQVNMYLPIHFVIEDNGKSVCTDTRKAWMQNKLSYEGINDKYVTFYSYKSKWPHAGAGKRIQF